MGKRQVLFSLLLVFVIFFALGYMYYEKTQIEEEQNLEEYTYVGPKGTFKFYKSEQGDHWLTWPVKTLISGRTYSVQEWNTPFPYGPFELLDIPMEEPNHPRASIRGPATESVTLTRDVYLDEKYHEINPKGGMVIALISTDRLIEKIHINSSLAAIEENEESIERELPIVNCDDATRENLVVWFKEGDETRIYRSEDNFYCLVAEFKEGEDPNRVATKLAYNIIGVM